MPEINRTAVVTHTYVVTLSEDEFVKVRAALTRYLLVAGNNPEGLRTVQAIRDMMYGI